MKDIENIISHMLSWKRMHHTRGVASVAMQLAERYGVSTEKAYLAGLLHDMAKEYPIERQRSLLIEAGCIDEDLLAFDAVLHGPVAALEIPKRLGITDPEILEAVRVHTTGKVGMSALDKVLFVADAIEPSRMYPGVEDVIQASERSLNEGTLAAFDHALTHLISWGRPICMTTMLARNALIREMEKDARV